jgi:SAM-dependent methyltransferase
MKHDLLADFPSFDQVAAGLEDHLLKDFTTYYEESKFGLTLIIEDLAQISENSSILEIGSGIGLLSQYLVSKGLEVTSIEPAGQGFGMMSNLQEHVKFFFSSTNSKLKFHHLALEDFNPNTTYDYVFSINVFEHIENPMEGLRKTYSFLEDTGFARIITPNYGIPYEPHFNVPIFFSKKLTYVIFRSRILNFNCFDPIGLWESLNWISIGRIQRMLIQESIVACFSLEATHLYFGRLEGENQFLARKGPYFKFAARNLRFLLRFLPTRLYPILDLKVAKSSQFEI